MSRIARPVILPLIPSKPRLRFLEGAEGGAGAVEPPAVPSVEPAAETPNEGESALGDAGKKALDAMKAERNAAKEEARLAKAELAKREADKPDETAIEAARREATEAATKIANERLVRAELKAAATGRLIDVSEALLNIDTTQFEVDAHGEIDPGVLSKAVDDLLTKKPYLAATQPLFTGGGDGGAGAPPKPEATVDEQIATARAAKDWRAEISLQNQKMPELPA